MTLEEIKADVDSAETWPNSGVLNWGEVGWDTLAARVALHPEQAVARTEAFDAESVMGFFEEWWRAGQ